MLRTRALVFCALYIAAVAYLSLFPFDFRLFPKGPGLIWAPLDSRRQVLDAVLNFFFYVPMGASLALAIHRPPAKRTVSAWVAAALLSGSVSWTIEWLQLWTPARYSTYNDLITNATGAIGGAVTATLVLRTRWWQTLIQSSSAGIRPTRSAGLFFTLWVLWRAFPFVPRISLAGSVESFRNGLQVSWIAGAEALLGFAVLGLTVRQPIARAVALSLIPAQILLRGQDFALSALVGAIAGGLLADRLAARGWAIVFPLYLGVAEFRPFRFSETPLGMTWQPFGSWYASPEGSYPSLLGKLLLYTGTVWVMRRASLGWIAAVGVPFVILAAGEWAQRYLPGRTPETTDLVLLLAGATLILLTGSDPLQPNQFRVQREQNEVEGAQ